MRLMTLAAAIALSVVLSATGAAYAASVGGGEVTGKAGNFSLGVEYDNMFNRDMKFKSGTLSLGGNVVFTSCNCKSKAYPDTGDSINCMKSKSRKFLAKGTLGVHERVDVFVRVGMASFDYEYKYKSPGSPDTKEEFEGDYGLAYRAGIIGRILETSSGLKLAGTAQYMQYESDGTYKEDGKEPTSYGYLSYTSSTEVTEWHVAAVLSKEWGSFAPFGGVRYSSLEFENTSEAKANGMTGTTPFTLTFKEKAESHKNVGIFGGADFKINDRISANAEVRLLDETAASVGARFSF